MVLSSTFSSSQKVLLRGSRLGHIMYMGEKMGVQIMLYHWNINWKISNWYLWYWYFIFLQSLVLQIVTSAVGDQLLYSAGIDQTIRAWNPEDGNQAYIVEVCITDHLLSTLLSQNPTHNVLTDFWFGCKFPRRGNLYQYYTDINTSIIKK